MLQRYNIKVGDYIVAVGDVDTKRAKHDEVVCLVRKCGANLRLKLITPLNDENPENAGPASTPSTPKQPLKMQSPGHSLSGQSSKSSKSRLSAPWIFAKKGSKDKDDSCSLRNDEFILLGEDSDKFSDHDILM